MNYRFGVMDRFGDYRQLISMASPPVESYANPAATVDLVRIVNDEMAELVLQVLRLPSSPGGI